MKFNREKSKQFTLLESNYKKKIEKFEEELSLCKMMVEKMKYMLL